MIITADKLNAKYLNYCNNQNLDSKDEKSTKKFIDQFCKRNKFNHVQQVKWGFEFTVKLGVIKKKIDVKS